MLGAGGWERVNACAGWCSVSRCPLFGSYMGEGVAYSSAVKAAHYEKEYNIINIYE